MTQHSTVMKCIAVLFDALSHCFDIYEYSICRHSERTNEKKVKGTREGMQPKGSLLLLLTCVVRSNFTGCMRVPCVRIDMALCHHRRFCSCPAFLSLSISPSLSFSPCFSCFLSSCMFFFRFCFTRNAYTRIEFGCCSGFLRNLSHKISLLSTKAAASQRKNTISRRSVHFLWTDC